MPDPELLRAVMEAYERGQTLEALRQAETFAPLKEWQGVKPCVVAARIAANAGAPGLGARLSHRAWRADKRDAEAIAQYGYELLHRRGPLAAWQTLRGWTEKQETPAEHAAEVLALRGIVAIELRDFANAETFLARAESMDPDRPWIRLPRARLLEAQDRVEEALEVARTACALHRHPFYRAGVQTCAHLLQLLDRDEDAIGLLHKADQALQNGPVAAQLYGLLSENGCWAEAEEALERFVALSPMLEKQARNWLNAQRARVAYRRGRRADAARLAGLLEDDFHKRFAARLGDPPARDERVQLDVTFVRQHFKTCAPATLAAIGRFWRMPAEHLKLAEAICYDGTPLWQQREWAEKNGWHVREFRVTPENAVPLLERGIPFALCVVESTSAHMMAGIGFDRTRSTLLLRDPGQPYIVEVGFEEFLKRYRPFGPHGVVFVPAGERSRLEGLELPESAWYDCYHRFWLSLSKHDRMAAAAALSQLEQEAADAALTWEAQLDLANYDANNAEQARCLEKLLELFPLNAARLLRRFECMRDASRQERIQWLERACNTKEADPALLVALARAMQGDARCVEDARRRLKQAFRLRPLDASAIVVLADLHWQEGNLEEATEYYRFAANLEGFRENLYQSWFLACRRTRHADEALAHLQDRFARFGHRSDQPALTLAWAWREMEQPALARKVLAEAMTLRPEDGYLLLRAATHLAALGETTEAEKYLNAARGRVRENDWLRGCAEIAENRLDFEQVLKVSRELVQREPLALDGHAAVARVLARREGTAAALAELKKACAAFPHHYGLRRMLVDWSRGAGQAAVEATSRELLRLEPSDAWSRRELALALMWLKRAEEALGEAAEAARIEPLNTYSFSVLGLIHQHIGQVAEARAHFRRSVALSVDNHEAIQALLELARTDNERKEDLSFIEQELVRQVVAGDGLLVYVEIARGLLEPEALLRFLRRAHEERPDLWHAWSALVSQLVHIGQLDEALAIATQASERFPHLPRTWLDLAMVRRWRNQADEELAATERAFEISPAWNSSALALTAALERRSQLHEAWLVYQRALSHSPRDPQLNTFHANLLWRQQRKEEAFGTVERALRLAPAYDWAWDLLAEWSAQSGQPERPSEFARSLTAERPGEMRVWMTLARMLVNPQARDERLAAVEQAIALEPGSTDAWDLKANLLAIVERFEEAIQACTKGAAVCTVDTHVLCGRHAWVEAQRRHLPEAIRLMRAVLKENASYLWGWHQLAIWLLEQGELDEATAALQQMRKLRPHDAWVNRQLGFLLLKRNDFDGAQKAFASALEASPTDVAAAQNLFELQLRASDLRGADATLQRMRLHQPGAATAAAEIVYQLRQRPDHVPRQALETLCASLDPDPWPVDMATDTLLRADQANDAIRVFKRAIKAGPCNPQLGVAVIRLLLAQRATLAATWFFSRLKAGELQRRAAAPLVLVLAENKCRTLLRWLLWRRREVLYRDDMAWGQVGYALSNFNRMKQVARWLSDWRQRSNVQPWMLFNYCLALRHQGRYDEATEVARHVLQTWGHREGASDMHLFLAVEDALAGAVPAAQDHLKRLVVREGNAHDQQLCALAKALMEFQSTPGLERSKRFRALRQELAPYFGGWQLFRAMRDVRRTFRRVGEVLFHREGAGLGAWLWFKWKLNWQWSLMPLAVWVASAQPAILVPLLIILLAAHRAHAR